MFIQKAALFYNFLSPSVFSTIIRSWCCIDSKWWVSIRTGQICVLWSRLFRFLASTQRMKTKSRDQASCHQQQCCVINKPGSHVPQVWWWIPLHCLRPQGSCTTSVTPTGPDLPARGWKVSGHWLNQELLHGLGGSSMTTHQAYLLPYGEGEKVITRPPWIISHLNCNPNGMILSF